MIYIYESTEIGIPSHMGLGALSPSSCVITETINGEFSLHMVHPIDADGKWEKLDQQRIIKAPTHRGDQLFRIYNIFKDPILQKSYIVLARHIFYDLMDNFLEDVRPTVKDGHDAGNAILAGCQYATAFTFDSDITAVSTAYYIRKNPAEALIGPEDQSFINRWGGEIDRDNYDIAINTQLGADNGVKITYRKNLTGLDVTVDDSTVVTRVIPTALDADGTVFYTAAKYYDSTLINDYPHPKYGVLNTGIRVGQAVDGAIPFPDEATALTAMAAMAAAYFTAGADQPKVTLNVSYIDISKTAEYAEYALLFSAAIGDTVTVYYPPIDIDLSLRIVTLRWNAVLDQPYATVIGDAAPNIAQNVVDNDIDISALKTNVDKALMEGEVYNGVYINHTDGVMTVATVGGKEIKVKHTSTEGLSVYADDVYIGGVALVNGTVAMVSGALTNDIDGDCYAVIGETTIDGATVWGIKIFNTNVSTTDPACTIATSASSPSGAMVRIISNGGSQFWLSPSATIGTRIVDKSGKYRMTIHDSDTYLYGPDESKHIGVDNTGAYKYAGGVKTYL